jgi:RNA polymerase sigma-70 factor (ECF subfamily)
MGLGTGNLCALEICRICTQPRAALAGVSGVMPAASDLSEVFRSEFGRLVSALAVGFGTEAAADAVQEAFIAADRRWTRVGAYDDPAAWVRHVALNRLRNERRNARRRAEILSAVRAPSPNELTDELLDLRAALALLPRQQRASVCLHYLGGYTVDEVAAAMTIAPGTVKSHLSDARARLRLALLESDDA